MKALLSAVLAVALVCTAAPASYAEPRQVLQGTQVHLTLLSTINSAVAKDGDPFVAIVAEPIQLGTQMLIPAGTRVNGTIGTIGKARYFAMFKGQAYMNLSFHSMEIDSRLIPIQMSILAIVPPNSQPDAKPRKDVKVEEGQVVQEKRDIKGAVIAATIGAGGGSLAGALFGKVVQGFGIGLAGSAAYIMIRKGKEVELPVQTGFLVRMDNTITVPATTASNTTGTEPVSR